MASLASANNPAPTTDPANADTDEGEQPSSSSEEEGVDAKLSYPDQEQEELSPDDVLEFRRFIEELRGDVLKQWIVYRNLEKELALLEKADPTHPSVQEKFIEERIKYDQQKKELEEFSKENGLKIPSNGTYL